VVERTIRVQQNLFAVAANMLEFWCELSEICRRQSTQQSIVRPIRWSSHPKRMHWMPTRHKVRDLPSGNRKTPIRRPSEHPKRSARMSHSGMDRLLLLFIDASLNRLAPLGKQPVHPINGRTAVFRIMRSKVRAYSHQGHGPRADQQAGYISATSDSTTSLAKGSRSTQKEHGTNPLSRDSARRGRRISDS
jgi:hypothetical protein